MCTSSRFFSIAGSWGAIVALCASVLATGAHAQAPRGAADIAWLGLYNESLVEWLDNQSLLGELCRAAPTTETGECRDENMKSRRHVVPLRAAPDKAARVVGELVIQATLGEGLSAYYRSPTHGEKEFVPDLFDADWGYGPFFHQTVLERRGAWFRLPSVPFSNAVWLNASDLGSQPDVRALTVGDIVRFRGRDLVFLGVARGIARMRPEQRGDMWCEEGEPPVEKPAPEIGIRVEKLYGPTGRLLVDIKYKRGC
jgi:hypothetical protein